MYQNNYQNPQQVQSYPFRPGPQGYGYGPKPTPKFTQPVTAEMSKLIHQQDNALDIKISKTDFIKNQCTHKEPGTGVPSVVQINPEDPSLVVCRTCGETFHVMENVNDEINNLAERLIDVMQTVKLMYVDAPEDFIKEFFQCISLIKKLPKIWEKASSDFTTYEQYSGNAFPINGSPNAFQAVGSMMTVNPFPNMAYGQPPQPQPYGQPQYGQGYGAPQPQPQPQYGMPQGAVTPSWMQGGYQTGAPQPQYGQPQQGYNPYPNNGYQAPPPAPNPTGAGTVPDQANPMAYGGAPAPVQNQNQQQNQPASTGEVTQTKSFNV